MVKKSKLTVPEVVVVVAVERDAMEALVAAGVAEVAFVVAEVAIAEIATEAIVAAAEVAIAETAMEAIGVAEEVAIAVVMEVAMAVGMEDKVMTRDPIRRILWL